MNCSTSVEVLGTVVTVVDVVVVGLIDVVDGVAGTDVGALVDV